MFTYVHTLSLHDAIPISDLQRGSQRPDKSAIARPVVVADRLLYPRDPLAIERPAAIEGLIDGQGLVVVDHQGDLVGQAPSNRPSPPDPRQSLGISSGALPRGSPLRATPRPRLPPPRVSSTQGHRSCKPESAVAQRRAALPAAGQPLWRVHPTPPCRGPQGPS